MDLHFLTSSAVDVHRIAELCMQHGGWSLTETRKSFRLGNNALWQGVAFRRTLQERISRSLQGNPEVSRIQS